MEFIDDLDAEGNFKETRDSWKSRNLPKRLGFILMGRHGNMNKISTYVMSILRFHYDLFLVSYVSSFVIRWKKWSIRPIRCNLKNEIKTI